MNATGYRAVRRLSVSVAEPGLPTVQAKGRARPGATVRARMPSVARSAPSGMTGKMPASFQVWSTDDQS